MADLGGDVHVMRTDSESWVPDDEDGGQVQLHYEDGDTAAGLWQPGDDFATAENLLPARETIVVLQGTVRIEIHGGPTLELGAGDVASMPRGARTHWHPSTDFKEVWLYS
jgi:uncharacterized cupin superfamily protein